MQDNKSTVLTYLGYILVVVFVVGGTVFVLNKYKDIQINNDSKKVSVAENEKTVENGESNMNEELKIEDLVVGTGAEATAGKLISVHYIGTLTNGTKFDSSKDRGIPFEFTLGAGQVIQGWDKGFAGMKVGGKRKLTIPSEMGYGSQGAGGIISPNATLIFEVELLGVK